MSHRRDWVLGCTNRNCKDEAEMVLSCPNGSGSPGTVCSSSPFPLPPFLMTAPPPPGHVPQACQLQPIPNHTHFPASLSKPNCACPEYLPRCPSERSESSAPPPPLPRSGEIRLDLPYNHGATICWGLTVGQALL